jgi:hypothetical protein
MQPNQDALARAAQYEQQANFIEQMQRMGMGGFVQGDPAALRTAAQQWRQYGLAGASASAEAAGRYQQSPLIMRNIVRLPDGTWVRSPELTHQVNPDLSETPVWTTPAAPGAPPGSAPQAEPVVGANGQPIESKAPPNEVSLRETSYDRFAKEGVDSYNAAQNTQGWLVQMNHAADVLNANGGFLGTGPTAPERLAFAARTNDALRSVGLPNLFDPNKISSWEELKKATTTAGFELSSHYEGHARQAATTIVNATSAVPSPQNSPQGFRMVSAGINEAAQSAIDLHNYEQSIVNQRGDLTQAATDFQTQYPPAMYSRRAISIVNPYTVRNDADLQRFLPGTFVRYGSGNNTRIIQVPERQGAPPIPDYLRPLRQQAQQ